MGIFFNPEKYNIENKKFNVELEFNSTKYGLFENRQFKFITAPEYESFVINIRDFEKGGSNGKSSQHEPGIKISKRRSSEKEPEFFIPRDLITRHNQIIFVDSDNLLKSRKGLIKFIKNFIIDNRVYLIIYWDEYRNKDIQEKCEKEIIKNFKENHKKYDSGTFKKTEKEEELMREKIYGKL